MDCVTEPEIMVIMTVYGGLKQLIRRNNMDKKEEYLKKLDAQLKEWKLKIEMLEAKTSELSSDAKTELMRELEVLRQKKAVYKDKWKELQKSVGEAWDAAKESVEKAAAELKQALDKVVSRFK